MRYIAQNISIIFIVAFAYIFIYDYIIFNESFIYIDYLKWLYYMCPTFLGLLIIMFLVLLRKVLNKYICTLLLTFAGYIFFISLFLTTGQYCNPLRNMSSLYMLLTIIIFVSSILLCLFYYKRIVSKPHLTMVMISLLILIIDFLWFNVLYFLIN